MRYLDRWYEVFDAMGEAARADCTPGRGGFRGEAAVLIPVTREASPRLILTRRAKHLASHPGQVSLPGGMWETADLGLHHTALRETEEEIGIPASAVQLVAGLSRRVSRHGVGVTPYAGLVDPAIEPVPSPDEIELVFHVPLQFFFEKSPERIDRIERKGVRYHMPAWFWEGHEIWGLTALILAEFCSQVCNHPEGPGQWPLSILEEPV